MTEIPDDLKDQLIDIIFGNNEDADDWEETKKDDLDNSGGIDIKVFPENATRINEVESFTADVDVVGYISYKYTRKNNAGS